MCQSLFFKKETLIQKDVRISLKSSTDLFFKNPTVVKNINSRDIDQIMDLLLRRTDNYSVIFFSSFVISIY